VGVSGYFGEETEKMGWKIGAMDLGLSVRIEGLSIIIGPRFATTSILRAYGLIIRKAAVDAELAIFFKVKPLAAIDDFTDSSPGEVLQGLVLAVVFNSIEGERAKARA